MDGWSVTLRDRVDLATVLLAPGEFAPTRYSFAVVGGPEAAEVVWTAPAEELTQALDTLRCPIEIAADELSRVWWGYVHEVELQAGKLAIGVTLDDLANKVMVDYEQADMGNGTGLAASTAWAQDAASIAKWGVKEHIAHLNNSTIVAAEAYRDRVLAARKNPIRFLGSGGSKQPQAVLRCRGWWQTLAWQRYSSPSVTVSNSDSDPGPASSYPAGTWAHFSDSSSRKLIAQSFHHDLVAFRLSRAGFRFAKRDGATNCQELQVELRSDSGVNTPGMAPGNLLARITLSNTDMGYQSETKTGQWIYKDWSTHAELAPATTYWLVFYQSDTEDYSTARVDSTHNYLISGSVDNHYSDGKAMKCNDAGAWSDFDQADGRSAWDLQFIIDAEWETSTTIADIVDKCGQFLSLGRVGATGIYQSIPRDGKSDGLTEMLQVLRTGTSDNRRVVSWVEPNREVFCLAEQSYSPATAWNLSWGGHLYDTGGARMDDRLCRGPGHWAIVKDMGDVPGALPAPEPVPTPVYIERAEYDVGSKSLRLELRHQVDPFAAGET